MTNPLEAASISNLREISDSGSPETPWNGSPLVVHKERLGCKGKLTLELRPLPPRPGTGVKHCAGLSSTWQGLSSRTPKVCPSKEANPKLTIDSVPRLSAADQRRFYFLPFSSRKQVRGSVGSGDTDPLDRRKVTSFQPVPRIHARWGGQLQRGSPKGLQLRL